MTIFTLIPLLAMTIFFSDKPKVGDAAPNFSALSTGNKTIKLDDYRGNWVVLYFYPKDFTRGFTIESCGLRDNFKELTELNVIILGVSFDDIDKQEEFKKAYELPFDLISDTDKTIAKSYDSVGFAGLYAKRKTYLIDPNGNIAYIFEKVDAQTHPRDIIKELGNLVKDKINRQPEGNL